MSLINEHIYSFRKLLQRRNDTDPREVVYIALQALEAAVMRRAPNRDVFEAQLWTHAMLEQALAGTLDVQEMVNKLWAHAAQWG
jgi:hypothetical protein